MFEHWKALRPAVRALVFLYWVNTLVGSLISVFTQIFLYQRFNSIPLNVLATLVDYAGVMLGFCVPGYLASVWRVNLKHGFIGSFVMTGVAIIFLFYSSGTFEAYIAMFLIGLGQGLFWLTVNTFELSETKDAERDFYASAVTAGTEALGLAGPAIATLLIWLSGTVFHLGTFTLLFTIAPFVYLLGLFSFSRLRDYYPKPIAWADVRHFFVDRRNQLAQLYTIGTGFWQAISVTIMPLVTLFILGTALKVGVFDTLIAIFSTLCVVVVAGYRTQKNRLLIYTVTTGIIILATIGLGYVFTFAALIAYNLVYGITDPLNSVSKHVIDLKVMDTGREGADFYATMLLRDLALWFWRTTGGLLFLALLLTLHSEQAFLSAGLYCIAGSISVSYLGGYFFARQSREK